MAMVLSPISQKMLCELHCTIREKLRFHYVLSIPPSFSDSERMHVSWSVAYADILMRIMLRPENGGASIERIARPLDSADQLEIEKGFETGK